MMMKIFGAALIISGGGMVGLVRVNRIKERLTHTKEVRDAFERFLNALKEKREAINSFLTQHNELSLDSLCKEDQIEIEKTVETLKNTSYEDSLKLTEQLLCWLQKSVERLEKEYSSNQKPLPLLTGSLGLMIVILLF